MWSKLVRISTSLLGDWKVYCFPHSYTGISDDVCERYVEGEYVPVVSRNYIYESDMLIVDLSNRVVHVIEGCKYRITLKIKDKVNPEIFKSFTKQKYLVVDIYGNVLNVSNVYDLYSCINSYPSVNVCLEVKPCFSKNHEEDVLLTLNEVNYFTNSIVIYGTVESSKFSVDEMYSFEVARKIKDDIEKPLKAIFEEKFILARSPYFIVNELLEKFDVMYSLESSLDGRLVSYISKNGIKKITHMNKLKKEIKELLGGISVEQFIDIEEMLIEAQFDEDYFSYIVSELLNV